MDDIAISSKDVYRKTQEKKQLKYLKRETSSKWNIFLVRHKTKTKLLQFIDEYKEQNQIQDFLPLKHEINDDAEELIENVEDFHLEGISNINVSGTVKRDFVKSLHPISQAWCQRCSRLMNPEVGNYLKSSKQTSESEFMSFTGKLTDVGRPDGNVFERLSEISSTDGGLLQWSRKDV